MLAQLGKTRRWLDDSSVTNVLVGLKGKVRRDQKIVSTTH